MNTQDAYRLGSTVGVSASVKKYISGGVFYRRDAREMNVVKYLTSEYLTVTDQRKIEFKDDGQTPCLVNTNIS
jgi:hypothetical protein